MKTRNAITLILIGVVVGLAASTSFDWSPRLSGQDAQEANKLKGELQSLEKSYSGFSQAFRKAAKLVQSGVVRIEVESKAKKGQAPRSGPPQQRRDPSDLWRRFFEGRDPEDLREFFKQMPRPQHQPMHGLGSGVIIDPRGYILTNNHVIAGFKDGEVHVTLFGSKTSTEAKVVGSDPKSDLAVIKIDAEKPLPALDFGDSEALEVGDWVIAVGHPFEYSNSVSAGIISAKGRTNALRGLNQRDFAVQDFIQTDAAINPGNSGGPLVNLRAEVVGISTFIASRSGGFQGLGFAVPSHIAKRVAHALISKGRVVRGYLGVSITDICDPVAQQFGQKNTEEMVKKLGLPSADGAFVAGVMPDTPASKAGLEAKDVIVEFDGRPIKSRDNLTATVRDTPVDKTIRIKVYRDGKLKVLSVRIAEQPDEVDVAKAADEQRGSVDLAEAYGLKLQTLTPEIAKRLGLKDIKGVMVTEVEPGSPAAQRGIKANDVILSVGLTKVASVQEFVDRIKEAEEAGLGIAVNVKGKGLVILK